MTDIVVEIEKPTGDLYYPKLAELVVENQMPYDIANATINLVDPLTEIGGLDAYDEITIILDNKDIFTGRLDKRITRLSTDDDSIEWEASDHGQVLDQIYVSSVKSYSTTNVGTILEDLRSSFVDADLTGTHIATGPAITDYNIPAWSKTLLTCFKELTKVADYNLYIDYKDIHFEEKPTTPSSGIGVFQSENLLSLNNYEKDVKTVKNYVKVIGDTGFSAFAQDAASQTKYHKREFVYTDPTLGSNNACQEIADAILTPEPNETIDVSIIGDVNIDVGDLIPVDIPKFNISGNYEVSNLTHMFSADTLETNLELGTKKINLSRTLLALGMSIDRISTGFL